MWVLRTSPWVGTAKQGRIHRNTRHRGGLQLQSGGHLTHRCAASNSAPVLPGDLYL